MRPSRGKPGARGQHGPVGRCGFSLSNRSGESVVRCMTRIEPFPVRRDGYVGMSPVQFSPKPDREALLCWCREHLRGWFNLRKLGDRFYGHQAWEAHWPALGMTVKFVVSRVSS